MNDFSGDLILDLISKGENQLVEFKSSFGKEVIESVVAFANSKGGKIFIGVNDSKKIVGILDNPEVIPNYINTIKQNTQPSLVVDIDKL